MAGSYATLGFAGSYMVPQPVVEGSMSKANKSTGGKTKGYSKTEETTEEAEEMDS